MKQLALKLWTARLNVLGTVAIAVLASLTTTFASGYFGLQLSEVAIPLSVPAVAVSASSLLDCDDGVYSPVQTKCVSQSVFDAEMQRLFAALGIDTSLYQSRTPNEN